MKEVREGEGKEKGKGIGKEDKTALLRIELDPNATTKLALLLRDEVMASVSVHRWQGPKEAKHFIVFCNSAASSKS